MSLDGTAVSLANWCVSQGFIYREFVSVVPVSFWEWSRLTEHSVEVPLTSSQDAPFLNCNLALAI